MEEQSEFFYKGLNHSYALYNKEPNLAKEYADNFRKNSSVESNLTPYEQGFIKGMELAIQIEKQKGKNRGRGSGMSM